GKLIETVETAATDHTGFVSRIIGRDLAAYTAAKPAITAAERVRVEALSAPRLGPVSLDVTRGEIVGLTGLIGSGSDDVPARLFGARADSAGTLVLPEKTGADLALDLSLLTPKAARGHGIAYLPADRLGEAGIGSLPVGDNIAMPVYESLRSRFGLTDAGVLAHAGRVGGEAGVKPNAPALPLAALSGGNAQKALMAKWLQTAPRLLLLDEPTQGVDVGARQQIWEALDRAAEAGTAILVASTDYDQLAQLCHRVLVFAGGTIQAELSGARLTKDAIADACYASSEAAA
ncbi:MAG: ATP-binding cassette domain-containing protein, partial [Pseudomonadota bacterium]